RESEVPTLSVLCEGGVPNARDFSRVGVGRRGIPTHKEEGGDKPGQDFRTDTAWKRIWVPHAKKNARSGLRKKLRSGLQIVQCSAYVQIIFSAAFRPGISLSTTLSSCDFCPAVGFKPLQRPALADDRAAPRRAQHCGKRG